MTADRLSPSHELLTQEYVLVQAWKKTASYIRSHNWYADTLELDRTAVNLPRFLDELAEQLRPPREWQSHPLRIVPAPKRQKWRVNDGVWEPAGKVKSTVKLRPLAHVSIRDQVAATAIMLCLADRVETLQGDPRGQVTDAAVRRQVVSYGNRLFCDEEHGRLSHRWGSAKLYRAYSQDYRTFLARPDTVAESLNGRVVIVHSDLRQFYDRVRPELFSAKFRALRRMEDDQEFYELALRILQWGWKPSDQREVRSYAAQAGLSDFSRVSLPQGLVASGFFANVVLLDFDHGLKAAFGAEVAPGLVLHDACRYVDDLRLVLTDDRGRELTDIEGETFDWLSNLLASHGEGLELNRKKTMAIDFGGDERPLVRQSRKMKRIQNEVSGGFDAIGGEEILDAVQGLLRSQQRYSESRTESQGWAFAPVADVRDDTVARFAAARYRTTYRSLRPLLSESDGLPAQRTDEEQDDAYTQHRQPRTRAELDDEARAFALGLIEQWVHDPSNVRLLRIGLDIWPAEDVLDEVLRLLRPFTETGGRRGPPRRVAWYCLAELLRAGATETGLVENDESLPDAVDAAAYRSLLKSEAARLASLPPQALPWYVKQQALLFLAANAPMEAPVSRTGRNPDTRHYREMIRYLRGERDRLTGADFATLAILARRSFLPRDRAVALAIDSVTPTRIEQIAQRDPAFACEMLAHDSARLGEVPPRVRDDLGYGAVVGSNNFVSLASVVLDGGETNPLRNELSLLRFASKFMEKLPADQAAITPSDVWLELSGPDNDVPSVSSVELTSTRVAPTRSIYLPPRWCTPEERWRFHLGFLLRFVMAARPDFASTIRPAHWREHEVGYRRPDSHWYQKIYGLFSGHSAFGDDWMPISDWVERLLFALLSWPGCRSSEWRCVQEGIAATRDAIDARLQELANLQGPAKSAFLLPWRTPRPDRSADTRPLRGCVVQLAIPSGPEESGKTDPAAIKSTDLTCSDPGIRRLHRNHLSAALAAVERMLDLRETHRDRGARLDWLILPELSVHPDDVRTHLIPFARAHKAIVLAGLTYQELVTGQPLVNSAVWVVPVWSPSHGLQIQLRRQGKKHLAPVEAAFNASGTAIREFRPCQWLVGYDWSGTGDDRPLWLSAAICYDATDLRLATDLRGRSDVFAIPALNRDVTTFDQMALALHYHMYQMVVVANNGRFGGSNAYWPHKDAWIKQVFHLHGQPQASIALFEIDDIADFIARGQMSAPTGPTPSGGGASRWKPKPAAYEPERRHD